MPESECASFRRSGLTDIWYTAAIRYGILGLWTTVKLFAAFDVEVGALNAIHVHATDAQPGEAMGPSSCVQTLLFCNE